MKNYRIGFLYFLMPLVILSSCTDVVEVEVPDGGNRLVVEASIKWEKGTTGQTQSILLSTSSLFFEQNSNAPVVGADVVVTKDDDGTEFIFEDQNNGVYTTNNFIPVLDQSYTLELNYNSQTYRAQEVLKSVNPILEIEQTIEEGFDEDEILLNVYFNDPVDIDNYYLGQFKNSNNPLTVLESEDDRFTNGTRNFLEYASEDLETGVLVDIELQGISESYYNYMNILIEQSESDDGPFATTPVQLKGNCKNIDDPNEEVLGYFRLSEVAAQRYEIE